VTFSARRLHLVGAGGAGMSAIGLVAYAWGAEVTGCDRGDSPYAERLRRFGIPVLVGHDPVHLDDGMEVVVSSALAPDTPELVEAGRRGLAVRHRAEILAEIVAARTSVCVGGAHGKTTTAAMIAYAARELGLDPTWLVGGEVPQLGANAGPGGGYLLVAEADESDGSIALLRPAVAVVTNIELDHHARFAGDDELRALFGAWTSSVPRHGSVIVGEGIDLPADADVQRFGVGEGADWTVSGLDLAPGRSSFWLVPPAGDPVQVSLRLPGAHNALNAAAAIAALAAPAAGGSDPADSAAALGRFAGVGRRFERRGEAGGALVVDDYAHNPTKLEAAIAAARAERPRRLMVCFQPHLYSRTQAVAERLGTALAAADAVVVCEIYPAREEPIDGVTSALVVDAARAARPELEIERAPTLEDAAARLRGTAGPGDLILVAGAGDVRRVGDLLLDG
jgi:UDP-N-acetylmuramate--alanine ligase